MSPRIRKTTIKDYRPILPIEARDNLTDLAGELGFIVTRRGTYEGLPSVPDFLTTLATCYQADPEGTRLALKVVLAANGLLPDNPTPPAAE